MKKVFKMTGSFFRTLPSGDEVMCQNGDELDDLTAAEITALGNKLTYVREELEPSDKRKGIDPEPELAEDEVEPSPVDEVGGGTEDEPNDDLNPDEDEEPGGDPEADEDLADDEVPSDETEPDEDDPEVDDDPDAKATHVGGGWYLLPNGQKVQGKENIPAEWV